MMKNLLIISALISFNLLTAQYNINWKEAPLNQIPIQYKLEHFNLRGPVQDVSTILGDINKFDEKGYLISGYKYGKFEFTYDSNKIPVSSSFWDIGIPKITDQLISDNKGRIIEKTGLFGEKYTYDTKGNWTGILNSKDNTRKDNSSIYTYDNNNRLIKTEYFKGKIIWEENMNYAKDGDFLLITTNRKDFENPSRNIKKTTYYKNGVFYGSVKNDNVKYDRYGNVIAGVANNGEEIKIDNDFLQYYKNTDPNCSEGNCTDGFGNYKYDNGNYSGFFKDGKKEGFGMYIWKNGDHFNGMWKNDLIQGFGTYRFKSGMYRQGIFYGTKMNGLGIQVNADKTGEFGYYEMGKLVTKYSFSLNNVSKGCVAGECKNGYGKFIFDDGAEFMGFFKNNAFLQGKWTSAKGSYYEGEFGGRNSYEGYGRYRNTNDDFYYGEHKNGDPNGRGVLYESKSKMYKAGDWKDGELVKEYKD